jgi:uncharacterized protein YecE (DUF72 family)
MPTTVYVGTSGYSYADWVGPVYPQGTDRSRYLERYATLFNAVELNYSYYRQPDPKHTADLATRTPEDFRFTIKAHKSLTHVVPDEWPREAAVFLEGIAPLVDSGKLTAVLLQFPFSFHYTRAHRVYLDRLCESLREVPLATEFRNAEWYSSRVLEALAERSIAWVCADYPQLEGLPPREGESTAGLGYLRFHGRNRETWWTGTNASRYDYLYSDAEIEEWIERIRAITPKTRILVAMFNNHWRGQAVTNALMLKKKLEAVSDFELSVPHPQ